jgi:hypothetical protein
MSPPLRSRPPAAPLAGRLPLVLLGAVWACVPSQPLDEYGRERASAAGSAGSGSAAAGAGGASAEAAGAGGQAPGPLPEPPGDAGGSDGGAADAGDGGAPLSPDAAQPDSPCAAGELFGPDERCYFLDATVASWAAASTACQARGAGWDLVRVRSAAESAFLGDVLAFEAWIGASDIASEGQWLWIGDAQPFWIGNGTTGSASGGAYVNWNGTEPNGGTGTNCARALPRSGVNPDWDAPWADLACATEIGAICESGANP